MFVPVLSSSSFFSAIAPPFDLIPAGLSEISTIRLRTAWTGPLANFVRASDSQTIDIGFNRSNVLDYVNLNAWALGTTASVTKWYDQSGTGNDFTQATVASQPTWDNIFWNGIPHIDFGFSGTSSMANAGIVLGTTRSYTTFFAGRNLNSLQNQGLIDAGANGIAFSDSSLRVSQFGSLTSNQFSNFRVQTSPSTQGFTANNNLTGWQNNVSQAMTQNGVLSTPAAGVVIGANAESAQAGLLNAACFAMWNTGLSSTNMGLVNSRFMNILGIPATANDRLVMDGDSITNGIAALGLFGWAAQIQQNGLLNRTFQCLEYGVSGQALNPTMINGVSSRITPNFNGSLRNCILIVFAGTNDIVLNGQTGAQTLTSLQTYCSSCRTAGWTKIIVVTMLPRGTTLNETQRQIYNTGITSDVSGTYYDAVADWGNDPNMGQYGNQNNLTYYANDAVHPNFVGHTLGATLYIAPKVNLLAA